MGPRYMFTVMDQWLIQHQHLLIQYIIQTLLTLLLLDLTTVMGRIIISMEKLMKYESGMLLEPKWRFRVIWVYP